MIESLIQAARSARTGVTFVSLCSAILRIGQTNDWFIKHLKSQLQQLHSRSNTVKSSFPADRVLKALSCYRLLLELYLTRSELQKLESSEQFAEMLRNRTESCERFFEVFDKFSPFPLSFRQSFGQHVELAIACWADLEWADREHLSAGFLVHEMFDILDSITIQGCRFAWRPPPGECPCAIAEAPNIVSLLSSVKKLLPACNGKAESVEADSETMWAGLEDTVLPRCLQKWKLKNFQSPVVLPILPLDPKPQQTLTLNMAFEDYRLIIWKKTTDTLKEAVIMGGKEILLLALHEYQSLIGTGGTAQDLIAQVEAFIDKHRKMDSEGSSILIVPLTCLSSDLHFANFVTLSDGEWVCSQVLDFAFTHHALLTGCCCDLFAVPLLAPGGSPGGPKVFYCNAFFYADIIQGNKKWRHDIHNYDFIYIPAHVDGNHFMGFGITILGASGTVKSFDSLNHDRTLERGVILTWLQIAASDIHWTDSAGVCPQQTNSVDCAIFTFLCGTYLHLVTAENNLAEFYSHNDIASVRKQLVLLATKVGNDCRGGTPWSPFSAGNMVKRGLDRARSRLR